MQTMMMIKIKHMYQLGYGGGHHCHDCEAAGDRAGGGTGGI
jgi:hypothetical protein